MIEHTSDKKISKKLMLTYMNVPQYWEHETFESIGKGGSIEAKYKSNLQQMPEGAKLFVYGASGVIFNAIYSFTNSITGIDFADYFKECFESTPGNRIYKDYVFVYNVGAENAVKKQFSGQLLEGLIRKITQAGKRCIVASTLPYTVFKDTFQVDFKNRTEFAPVEEERFITCSGL